MTKAELNELEQVMKLMVRHQIDQVELPGGIKLTKGIHTTKPKRARAYEPRSSSEASNASRYGRARAKPGQGAGQGSEAGSEAETGEAESPDEPISPEEEDILFKSSSAPAITLDEFTNFPRQQ